MRSSLSLFRLQSLSPAVRREEIVLCRVITVISGAQWLKSLEDEAHRLIITSLTGENRHADLWYHLQVRIIQSALPCKGRANVDL